MFQTFANNLIGSIIVCTLIIGALILYESKKHKREADRKMAEFWAREAKSNSVRRQDISQLDYITIPFDSLPFVETDDGEINACQKELLALKGTKILNLSGISNTDLKLQYGVANLPQLSEYDEACTRMFRIIANLGFHLSQKGYHDEAVAFLEYGISAGSDLSRNYYVLADEYILAGRYEKVRELITHAESITSPMGPSILRELNAKLSAIC